MKRITLRTDGKQNSKEVFRAVAEHSPQKPISVSEMRKRVKLLDVLDAALGDSIVVEDAEWQVLKDIMESFPWSQATKQLLAIIDDVINAAEVSQADLKVVEKPRQVVEK